jgi:uncharacterized repeat protein (TIGR02543 family)
MNIKTIYTSAVVFLALLFATCDIAGLRDGQIPGSSEKAAVQVKTVASNLQSRTVAPGTSVDLEATDWRLLGGTSGNTETLLAELSDEARTVYLAPGTWDFTLEGYKDGVLILSGTIADKTISLDSQNILEFTVAPVFDGAGTVSIAIELPVGSGITEARIFKDGTEIENSIEPVDNWIVREYTSQAAGDYYFSVRLYKGDDLYGVVSEVIQVRANLESAMTYTLTKEDLNLLYVITFDAQGGVASQSSITVTVGERVTTLPTVTRMTYTFNGWFTQPNGGGSQFTPNTPVNEDVTVYARWTFTGATLTEEGVYIGIISFAGDATDLTDRSPIFLDSLGKDSLISKIDSDYAISPDGGTALFYGVHKALANLESIATYPDNLASVNVITFTDGLDNGSTGMDILIEGKLFNTEDEYATYVDGQIDNRTIGDSSITAYSVGVKGNDVTNESKFQSNLEKIASDGKDYMLTDFEQVKATFKEIADTLQTEYEDTNFNMKTTRVSNGTKVRLTFETEEAPNAEVNSSRFIEGTVTQTRIGENVTFTLNGITYGEGLGSIQSAGPIAGTVKGSEVTFAFTGMSGFNPATDGEADSEGKPVHAKQWLMPSSETEWQVNSEYKIDGASETVPVERSVIIYLILDASNSLNTTQIEVIREAANEFINSLYDRLNP